ncbi:unnamed protein product [Urochloa humidicola]
MEGHTTVTEVADDGEPKSPAGVKTTFVNQIGALVRENIPIKYKLGKRTTKDDNEEDIILVSEKAMSWTEIQQHYFFPEDRVDRVMKWALKKMAIQFQTFKKKLVNDFVSKGLTPDFEKHYKKQR